MRIIAHRGNLHGPNHVEENHPDYLKTALSQGFDVEVDVWMINGCLFLGHDKPTWEVDRSFVMQDKIWVHAKNVFALHVLKDQCNVFFHDSDDFVLTSENFIWTYPGKKIVSGSISVLPEKVNYSIADLSVCYGVCTDYSIKYADMLGVIHGHTGS